MSRFSFAVLLVVVSLARIVAGQAPGIAWQRDLATAQQTAAQTNRLVLVHFWAPWCKPCLRMEQEVFQQPTVVETLNAQFCCVKINVDEQGDLARHYGVKSLPTEVILAADGRLVAQLPSPPTANQYVQQISNVTAGYRQMAAKASGQLAAVAGMAERPASMSPAALAQPTQGDPVGPYNDQRYAEYFQRRQAEQPAAPTTAVAATVSPQIPVAQPPVVQPPAAQPPVSQPVASQPVVSQADLPAGSPPLAMDGYCPVQLKEHKRWVAGDKRWGAIHRGRTYLFIGPQEQQKFLTSPDAFAPVMAGNDPVAALDGGQYIPGRREFGVFYEDRVFLFSGEDSLQRFYQNPGRYSAEVVQARR